MPGRIGPCLQRGQDRLPDANPALPGVAGTPKVSPGATNRMLSVAGEVVAKAVADVTQLINEAVGQIVPIMSQAIAEAPATFGQSIAAAIPECVRIATDCAGRIAGKMAALLSSGENLMKLIDGAVGVLKIVRQAPRVAWSSPPAPDATGATATGEDRVDDTQLRHDRDVDKPGAEGNEPTITEPSGETLGNRTTRLHHAGPRRKRASEPTMPRIHATQEITSPLHNGNGLVMTRSPDGI
ncbi:hypothetical protein [Actinophytocola sp.]|uniref:hypothetical protein n=1 Tax=Actinophytocola sp. TaxID=1872138 RepID=UPI003D6A3F1A